MNAPRRSAALASFAIAFALLGQPLALNAEPVTFARPEQLTTFDDTLAGATPAARCRIELLHTNLRRQLASLTAGTSTATSPDALLAEAGLGALPPGGDVAQMAFIVLMEATNDQSNDLALIMTETKAQTNAKQSLREVMNSVSRKVAAQDAQRFSSEANLEVASAKLPPGPCMAFPTTIGPFARGPILPTVPDPAAFRARRQSIQSRLSPDVNASLTLIGRSLATMPGGDIEQTSASRVRTQFPNATPEQISLLQIVVLHTAVQQLDAMNDASDMQQMRLQSMMDRRQKFIEALSNIMKKTSETSDTLVQNMK